jgi:hypothetical protein
MKRVRLLKMKINRLSKTIKAFSENIEIDWEKPSPAVKSIPEWFKSITPVDEEKHDLTIKKCVPVLDSFTAGYLFKTSVDVMYDEEYKRFVDNGLHPEVTFHPQFQITNMELDSNLHPYPFKWINRFYWQTPKGYSTMFIHPLNRSDLPFQSLSGIVDTDEFPLSVQFPFFMKKGFSGLIPAGTPIIQAIPFKRDDYNLIFPDQKESYEYEHFWNWFQPPMAKYKRLFWKRKKYQ